MHGLKFAGAVALAVFHVSLFAASPAADPPLSPKGEKLVCENVEELGSRLRSHRECKTRAQWAEERRLNREMIDRSQTQRSCGGAMTGC